MSADPRVEAAWSVFPRPFALPALAAFLVLIAAALAVRYTGIMDLGLQRGDAPCYWRAGVEWSKGHFEFLDITGMGRPVYRPMSFLVYAIAMWLFGVTDYSIKLMHAGMDTLTVALTVLIGFRLTRRFWLALVPAVLYAFHPRVLQFARGEYVHAHSTLMVVGAFACLLAACGQWHKGKARTFWTVLSGLLIGAAGHTHEELGFLAAPFAVCLAIEAWAQRPPTSVLQGLRTLWDAVAPFVAGFGAVYVVWLALYEPGAVAEVVQQKVGRESAPVARPSPYLNLLRTPFIVAQLNRYLVSSGLAVGVLNVLTVLAGLAAAVTALPVFRHLHGPGTPRRTAVYPFILFFANAALAAFWKPEMPLSQARILLPVTPLYLCALTVWVYAFFGAPWRKMGACASYIFYWHYDFVRAHWRRLGAAAVAAASLGYFSAAHLMLPFDSRLHDPIPAREVYDLMKDRVSPHKRILLTPHIYSSLDGYLTSEVYFGDSAVYLMDQRFNRRSFEDLLDKFNIAYVYQGSELSGLEWREAHTSAPSYFGFKRTHWIAPSDGSFTYTLKKDYAFVEDYLDARGAILLYDGKLGRVYRIARVDANFARYLDYAAVQPPSPEGRVRLLDVNINGRTHTGIRVFDGQQLSYYGYRVKPRSSLMFTPYLPWRFRKAVEEPRFVVELVPEGGEPVVLADTPPIAYERTWGKPIERRRVSLAAFAGQTVAFRFRYSFASGKDVCHGLWVDPKVLTWSGPAEEDEPESLDDEALSLAAQAAETAN